MEGRQTRSKAKAGTSKITFSRPVTTSNRRRHVEARKLNKKQRTEEQIVCELNQQEQIVEQNGEEHNVEEQHIAQISYHTLKKPCNLVTTSERSRRVKAKKPNKNQGTFNELNVKEKNEEQNIEEQNAEELNVEEQHAAYASFDNSKRPCNQVTEAERSVCVKARKLDRKQRAWEKQNVEQKAEKHIVEEQHAACISLASKKSCNSVTVSKRSRCVKARKLNIEKRIEEQNAEEGNAERQNVEEKNLKENNVKEQLTCDDVGISARHNAQTFCGGSSSSV